MKNKTDKLKYLTNYYKPTKREKDELSPNGFSIVVSPSTKCVFVSGGKYTGCVTYRIWRLMNKFFERHVK